MEEINKLKTEDQDFYTYLRLNGLRSNKTITPEDLKKLTEIAQKEKRSKELEELYNKVIDKKATTKEYSDKYEEYKKELEQSIKTSLEGKKELSEKSAKLIEYFNLEIKRVNTELTDEEKATIEVLRKSIQKVRTLEEAHRKVNAREIPTQVLKTLREKYKREIKEELKSLGLNEKDYLPDDTVIYDELEEINKKEVPKEVRKSSLNDIKPVFDIKKESDNKSALINDIAEKESEEPKEETNVDFQKLKDENSILQEKVDLLKTKVEYLEKQIKEIQIGGLTNTINSDIPKEYMELAKYFKLDLKRSRNEITDEELIALRELTRSDNKMINDIENVVRMKANGELSIKDYNEEHSKVYDKYKTMLEEVVKGKKQKTK